MGLESYALDELTWPEVGRVLARDARLLLPVGALEQHGPHLPLGTNTFIAEAVCREVSRDCRILLAPTFPYGVTGPRAGAFAGTATLRRKTLHRAVNELLAAWEDHGVAETILLSAHRYDPHLDALLMALTAESVTTVVDLYAIDVSDVLEGTAVAEHAGELETSLMLHLAPGRVRADQIHDVSLPDRDSGRYIRGRMPTPPPASQGVVGYPSRATAAKGEAVFRRYVHALASALSRPRVGA